MPSKPLMIITPEHCSPDDEDIERSVDYPRRAIKASG